MNDARGPTAHHQDLERTAQLARDAALEEAAKVAELQIEIEPNLNQSERGLCRAIAGNIRAIQSTARKTVEESTAH